MQIQNGGQKYEQVIGVMSGTSLDGLDLIAVSFWEENGWKYEIIAAETIAYDEAQNTKLKNARTLDGLSLINLDLKFGTFIGRCINKFVHRHKLAPSLIGSHGHTVFHQPQHHLTYQIGNGSAINLKTGIKTISDFRIADVLNGGQGAPLVPVGDQLLFGDFEYCLNLGGFANISSLEKGRRIAFDICPCNMAINYFAKKAGFEFDRDGILASQGNLIEDLLIDLNALEFYNQKAPKSLGVEWFEQHFVPIISRYEDVNDALYTITHHIAYQISKHCKDNGQMLVTGGGAKNKTLVKELKNMASCEVIVPNQMLIDYKEALIFAFLAVLKDKRVSNTLASVTGADEDLISGIVHDHYPPKNN